MTAAEIVAALERVRDRYRRAIGQIRNERDRLDRLDRGLKKNLRHTKRILHRLAAATAEPDLQDQADWWKSPPAS